jgi:hypothetical protein
VRTYSQLLRYVASLDRYVRNMMLCMILAQMTGCTTAAMRQASKTSLEFLQDGHTSKEEVILKLGPPLRKIEWETILFYRLGKTKEGYVVLAPGDPLYNPGGSTWLSGIEGKFSLVLVFDNTEVLQKHSVVPID